MILSDVRKADGKSETFDALFRRAGVRHPDALALVDPPNRADRKPRVLTYGETDRAISALAVRLRALGLLTDSVIAVQLGNTVESVITLLAVLRAGMIAVPLPVLWRQQELIDALSPLGPKAIITASRIGAASHVDVAMQVAAELFPVRYVCAFGDDIPDGVVPLDDLFDGAPADLASMPRREQMAAHVAVVTMDASADGAFAVARSQEELTAGGMAVFAESGSPQDDVILSTIPIASFAGLSAALVPWLLSGGTLHLHHGFDAGAFVTQRAAAKPSTVIVPAAVIEPMREAGQFDEASRVLALWRSPERMASAEPWQSETTLIDIAVLGETAIVVAKRGDNGLPRAIPNGAIRATDDTLLLETMRTKSGLLAVRGPMVPVTAFPPGIEESGNAFFEADISGYVEIGFMCRLDNETQKLTVTGATSGLASIGGYSIRTADIETRLAKVDANATVVAVPDALLGQRLAGQGRDRTAAFLQAFGLNALVTGAFKKRKPAA